MAKGSGKGKKDGKPDKGKLSKKDEKQRKEAAKRSRFVPVKTPVHDADMLEISALRAFLTSFVFFILLLAPVLGLGLYFAWDLVVDIFSSQEEAFMAGMGIGVGVSFIIAVLFTRRAVASS